MKYVKFMALLVVMFFILAYVSIPDHVVQDWLTVAFIWGFTIVMTITVYYGIYRMIRDTLRWIGRQLNYDRNNGK